MNDDVRRIEGVLAAIGVPQPAIVAMLKAYNETLAPGGEPATFSEGHRPAGRGHVPSEFLKRVVRVGGVLDHLAPQVSARYREEIARTGRVGG